MAVEQGGRAPYAPAKAVVRVIERHRDVGLRSIDQSLLVRIGVSEPLAPRTHQTLRLLDFIDDQNNVTPEFAALRTASTDEFKPKFAELLRSAYADVFALLDPDGATHQQVEDAFRRFEPTGQLVRMVQLFTGLLTYAEIITESPKRKTGPKSQQRLPKPAGDRRPPDTSTPSTPLTPLPPPPPDGQPGGSTVSLSSGGSVSLKLDVDLLTLSRQDREFVLGLVDRFQDYDTSASADTEAART